MYKPQSVLFPKYPLLDQSIEDFHLERESQRFHIKDDLLYQCITYGDGLDSRAVQGFTITKGIGYALLVYFIRHALGIDRVPFYEDRVLSNHATLPMEARKSYREIVEALSDARMAAITSEVTALYRHTQEQLKNKGLTHVTVVRHVTDQNASNTPLWSDRGNYAQYVYALKQAATLLGHESVRIEMDTLNSFGDDGGYGYHPVCFRLQIPIEDIFYCSNLIASRSTDKDAVEAGEWVVINRAVDGMRSMPVDAIEVDEKYCKQMVQQPSESWAKRVFSEYETLVLRGGVNLHPSQGRPGHSGIWTPTVVSRLIAAWRGFQRGLE